MGSLMLKLLLHISVNDWGPWLDYSTELECGHACHTCTQEQYLLSCLRQELALHTYPYHCLYRDTRVASVGYITLLFRYERNPVNIGMLVESEAYLPARGCAISRLETQCNTQQDRSPNQMMRTSCKEKPYSSTDKSHREGRIPCHQTCRGHTLQKENPWYLQRTTWLKWRHHLLVRCRLCMWVLNF